MAALDYEITVVDAYGNWHRATAPALMKTGVPMAVAIRWAKVRREMSPAGLKRKLKDLKN